MINYEGGAIPEEYQAEYVADRVDTTANVFMGLTMGCARCHDHKYDPISQKDYYRFFAFFNTIAEKGLDGKNGNAAPILEMPTAEQASEAAWLQQSIAEHEAALPGEGDAAAAGRLGEDAPGDPAGAAARRPAGALRARWQSGRFLRDHRDGRTVKGTTSFAAGGPDSPRPSTAKRTSSFRPFRRTRFAVAFWMRSGAMPEMTVLEGGPGFEIGVEESHPQPDFKRGSPLYVEFQGRRWHSDAIVFGGQWHHVALNFENGATRALLLDGKPVGDGRRSAGAARAGRSARHRRPASRQAAQGRRRRPAHLRPPAHRGRGRSAGACMSPPLHPGAGGEQALEGAEAAPARLFPDLRRPRRSAPRLRAN